MKKIFLNLNEERESDFYLSSVEIRKKDIIRIIKKKILTKIPKVSKNS